MSRTAKSFLYYGLISSVGLFLVLWHPWAWLTGRFDLLLAAWVGCLFGMALKASNVDIKLRREKIKEEIISRVLDLEKD